MWRAVYEQSRETDCVYVRVYVCMYVCMYVYVKESINN